jgi:hypothetical protein
MAREFDGPIYVGRILRAISERLGDRAVHRDALVGQDVLEYLTIAWNVIEAIAAMRPGSPPTRSRWSALASIHRSKCSLH